VNPEVSKGLSINKEERKRKWEKRPQIGQDGGIEGGKEFQVTVSKPRGVESRARPKVAYCEKKTS